MTIEAGSGQNVSRSASANDSRSTKGKQNAAADAGAGGFGAVLAAVETPEAAEPVIAGPTAPVPLGKDTDSKSKIKTSDAGTVPAGPGQADSKAGASDAAPQVPDYKATVSEESSLKTLGDSMLSATDPAAVAASTAAAMALFGADPAATSDVPMDTAALLAQSAVWNGGTVGGEQTLPSNAQASAVGGVTTAPRPAPTPLAAPPQGMVSPEAAGEQLADGLKKAAKGGVDASSKSLAAAEPSAKVAVAPDSKATAINQRTADLQTAPLATAIATASLAQTFQREDQPRERSVFRSAANEGTAAPQAVSSASPTLTVSNAPEVIAPTEALVAEKVSYWISNNVQNAEMKLDGIGERPVEVSIRMQGNEAHVSFRTDELQTRAALENAGVHLKDLLQREGLVLSGVSVGTAGTGDSGAQDRKSRQGARQATVAALQPVRADSHAMSGRVTSTGLDLFV
jgi:flagellar hook-length control protein FliK